MACSAFIIICLFCSFSCLNSFHQFTYSPAMMMMRSLISKSSGGCFVSAAAVAPTPALTTPLRLPLHPSLSKLQLSIFHNRHVFHERKAVVNAPRFQHFVVPSAISRDESPPLISVSDGKVVVVAWSAATLLIAVANRVLQKLALVPMKDHPFFLAQLNSFAFVAVFFSALHVRYRGGVTTDEMLGVPKLPFVVIGFLELCSSLCGMYAGAMLPGPAIPLLYQTFLIWQLAFSSILLRRRYNFNQITGCLLVAAGVVVAVSRGGATGMLSGVAPIWPALMIASSVFQAAASIFKEAVFIDAAKHLKGKSMDVFVVNSFASGFQALFTLALLPLVLNMKGMSLSQLPSYLVTGAACFLNIGTNTPGCDGAPLLPFLYIASNILFNISILNLLKVSNAIVASLAARAAVPMAMYLLSLPLPYLPKGVSLSPYFHLGSVILVVGLILYNLPNQE